MEIDSIQYWMEQLANRSPKTTRRYKRQLLRFSEWYGLSPNELIATQMNAKKYGGDDPREAQVLEGKVRAYMAHLEGRGLSGPTRRVHYTAIVGFFKLNLAPLAMTPQDSPAGENKGSRIPEKFEIVKWVNIAKSRQYRAAILMLKDSGLRISDVVKLRWDELVDFGDGFWGWRKIQTEKCQINATPFIGPEATEAIQILPRRDDRIIPISAATLANALSLIIKESGFKDVTAHGLRKFFNVELQSATVPKEWRYQMIGKRTGPYDENRMRILFEAYKSAYDHLRVFAMDALAFEAVKESLKELREENRRLREKTREIEDLKRELTDQRQTMKTMEQSMKTMEKALSNIQRR